MVKSRDITSYCKYCATVLKQESGPKLVDRILNLETNSTELRCKECRKETEGKWKYED